MFFKSYLSIIASFTLHTVRGHFPLHNSIPLEPFDLANNLLTHDSSSYLLRSAFANPASSSQPRISDTDESFDVPEEFVIPAQENDWYCPAGMDMQDLQSYLDRMVTKRNTLRELFSQGGIKENVDCRNFTRVWDELRVVEGSVKNAFKCVSRLEGFSFRLWKTVSNLYDIYMVENTYKELCFARYFYLVDGLRWRKNVTKLQERHDKILQLESKLDGFVNKLNISTTTGVTREV